MGSMEYRGLSKNMTLVEVIRRVFFILMFVSILTACDLKKDPLGSNENPIKLHFVPSVEAKVLEDNSKIFKKYLEERTPYKFAITIPQSYITVVEAFGTGRADISAMNTFGYVLANKKYGAEARLTVIRNGSPTYRSQVIARHDSPIQSLKDIHGKKVAFVDPASTSGYLLPLKELREKNIKPKEIVFAMKHDSVISMLYQGQVDAGATFYSPPAPDGRIEDARRLVLKQYPDVMEKIRIVALTDSIPNDPIVFRREMPEHMKETIQNAFLDFVRTPEGKEAFRKIFGVTDLIMAKDEDYEPVRKLLEGVSMLPTQVKQVKKSN